MLVKADTDQIMNQLRVELIGVSDALLRSMMFDVMTEFFNDSSSWYEWIEIAAQPDVKTYDVAPTEGQIIRLDGVCKADGTYVGALMPTIGVVEVRHAPNQAEQWFAKLIKNVVLPTGKDQYPIAPDWVLKQWHNTIKEGILGNLMNQKSKSWSDSKGALYHLSRFRKGINDARVSTLRANTHGAQAWRFPQSFRVRTQQGGVPSFAGTDRTFR